MDGRLLAAYRCLFEAAAPALQQQQASGGSAAGLGDSWAQHLQQAVARRSQQVLASMPTPLLEDLQQLAAWEQLSGDAPHCWAAALRHYSAAIAAYEAGYGSLLGAAAAGANASAAPAGGCSGSSSSGGGQPLLDAGASAGKDAALAQLLLQQARQQEGEEGLRALRIWGGQPESSGSGGSSIMLPVVYRAYKKLILADAILLAD